MAKQARPAPLTSAHRQGAPARDLDPPALGRRAGDMVAGEPAKFRGASVEGVGREATEHSLRLAGVTIDDTSEGVMITDPALRILAVNRAFCEITGYGEAEVVGRRPSLLRSGRHDREFFATMWASIRGDGRWQGEIWNRRKDGTIYPESLSISVVRDERGQVTNYVGVFSDLSTLKEAEARFDFLAHHDPLTGLPNRLLFTARGEHALARARAAGGRLAVIRLDLDLNRFEHLDDTLGNPAGEGLLRKVGERLSSCVRAGDTVGRLGGEGFTILLEELVDADSAAVVARTILDALAAPFNVAGNEVFVTACLGVSVFPEDGEDLPTLIKQAASALTRAKAQARGSLQFYTAELTRTAVERFRLENGLRQALHGNELVLHFQPQVSVADGRIVGAEALLRWHHPELGLIFPARFIHLAEETGLAEAVGAWVVRAACLQARAWITQGVPPLRVAVNLTAHEVSATPLAEMVARALAEAELAPRLLEVEITEDSVMADLETALGALQAVKALGVSIALDDFGTGYSSLNYLRRFPIDRLKLDGSFIRQVGWDESARAIVRAAIELGHGLKLALVAEGVESADQLEFLRACGCDAYQGHLFATALPPDELATLVRRAAS